MADITSTSNSRVKLARKLRRKRYREDTGLCVLEGVRLVRDAWQAGARFEGLFVAEERSRTSIADDPWAAVLAVMRGEGVPVFTVTDEVLAAMTETVTPQGVVALVRIPQLELSSSPHLILILDRLRDPGNVGTLLRSAAAAGSSFVLLGPSTVDLYNDKVLRAAMGAHFRLPLRTCANWEEIAAHIGNRKAYVADAGAELAYDQVAWQEPAALIVGGEATGPTDEAFQMAVPIAIPMHRATESLNAAMAGSVILFEAARQRRASIQMSPR